MKNQSTVTAAIIAALTLVCSLPTNARTYTWGPVELKSGQRFEACVSVPEATAVDVQASFHSAVNARAIRIAARAFNTGDGRCFDISYEQSRGKPVYFQIVTASERDDFVSSACVINGIFNCPQGQEARQIQDAGGGITEVSYVGPLRILPDKTFSLCANNAFNTFAVETSIALYRTQASQEPFRVFTTELAAGAGRCLTLTRDQVGGDTSFFVRLEYTASSVEVGVSSIVWQAALINGVIPYLPDRRKFTAVL
jgi:hypothetical protein